MNNLDELLTINEVAEALKISTKTLQRMRKNNNDSYIPYVLIGESSIRYKALDLTNYINKNTRKQK